MGVVDAAQESVRRVPFVVFCHVQRTFGQKGLRRRCSDQVRKIRRGMETNPHVALNQSLFGKLGLPVLEFQVETHSGACERHLIFKLPVEHVVWCATYQLSGCETDQAIAVFIIAVIIAGGKACL